MKPKQILLYCLILGMTSSLTSCFVDDIDEQKEGDALNDQQIQEYITDNGLNATGTDSGLFYEITESRPNAQEVADGDSVELHFVLRLLSGTIVDSTIGVTKVFNIADHDRTPETDGHLINLERSPLFPGLEEGIRLMKEKERATLLLPSDLAWGASGTSLIPPFSVLVYDIILDDIISQEEQIADYIERNSLPDPEITGVTVDEVEYPLRYIPLLEGTPNTEPKEGETVTVTYLGTLLNDFEFDSNDDSTFTFEIDAGSVIQGWNEGVKRMNQGEKGILIIPHELAYGRSGNSSVPPYAPLMFELTHVKTQEQQLYEYIADNSLQNDTASTDNGLIYTITQAGSGDIPSESSTVSVRYKASYIDNEGNVQLFDDQSLNAIELDLSDEDDDRIIEGLIEGLTLMKEGESRILMMPSSLAFGNGGFGEVPGRSPVIYEIELIDIL